MPKLDPASIYLTLSSPETTPEAYRWAIFVPNSAGSSGRLFCAAGKPPPHAGVVPPPGLVFEAKEYDLRDDPRLFLLLRLGGLGEWSIDQLHKILGNVSIPHPEDEYSQFFDSRTWVIKAIMRISAYGIMESRRLERMEQEIQDLAAQARVAHNQGGGWTLRKFECVLK